MVREVHGLLHQRYVADHVLGLSDKAHEAIHMWQLFLGMQTLHAALMLPLRFVFEANG
jgi:hypothetical protein